MYVTKFNITEEKEFKSLESIMKLSNNILYKSIISKIIENLSKLEISLEEILLEIHEFNEDKIKMTFCTTKNFTKCFLLNIENDIITYHSAFDNESTNDLDKIIDKLINFLNNENNRIISNYKFILEENSEIE